MKSKNKTAISTVTFLFTRSYVFNFMENKHIRKTLDNNLNCLAIRKVFKGRC